LILSFCFDFFYLWDRICFEKANSFNPWFASVLLRFAVEWE